MSEHIPVFRPSLDAEAVWRELRPVIESGWLGQGSKVEELEAKLAEFVHAKHFITTSSCTAALHLAVKCLNLPRGTSVLTTPITFISTNAVLLYEGLRPVFGRVGRDGTLIDVLGCYGTEAMIDVHFGGAHSGFYPSPGRALPLIEDCAHAFGAPWITRGCQGLHMRCWSFHAVKNLPMGDGGGISTNDDSLARRLRRLRWMGIDKTTYARSKGGYSSDYEVQELGFKYHMNDVTAAIGLATLPLVSQQVKRRQEIATRYLREFNNRWRTRSLPNMSACHFYPMFFDNREAVEASLTADNIAFSRHYKPNFLYAPFCSYSDPGRDSAMEYYRRALILPMFPSMTEEQIDRVIAAVRRAQ